MAMLQVTDLKVNYGVIQAIKGVSFEVNEGEVIALIGANGAGKTTILHTVTGLIVENRQKKGLYGIKNVSQGVWRGFYPDGKIKDIPNGQGIPIWNGMSVRFELGEEWNLRLMQQVEERKEDEDEQTV